MAVLINGIDVPKVIAQLQDQLTELQKRVEELEKDKADGSNG